MPQEQQRVVVVGAGLAGHSAALAAAEAGADVVLLEKQPDPGGSSKRSGASFAFGGTEEQAALGLKDSDELLRADLEKAGKGHADAALIDVYVANQRETYAWLKAHGVEFHGVSLSSGQAVPRTHPARPPQMIDALHERVAANARIDYRLNTAARRILTGETGGVRGVEAEGPDGHFELAGPVVIAAGGFVRNKQMLDRYAPALRDIAALGGPGNAGDGIAMARELGAALKDMEFIKGTFGVALDNYPDTHVGARSTLVMTMYRGGIIVNCESRRFINESQSYKLIGDACLEQPDGIGIQIFDEPIMEQSRPVPTPTDFEGAVKKELVRTAGTIRQLAERLGIDPDRLEETVETYNAGVKAGAETEFGRNSLGSTYGRPPAIETPPFHAIPCTTGLIATYCGLAVDPQMQVLRKDGEPISGLFAAGEVIGGLHGASYMSGSSLAKAAIFGRVAGQEASRLAERRVAETTNGTKV